MSSIAAGGGTGGIAAVASRVARGWAAVYTLGLATRVRDARRAEIASDVWEHHFDSVTEGRPQWRFTGSVFSRMVRGAPADLCGE